MQNHLPNYVTNGLDFAADRRVRGIIDEILSEKKFLLLLQDCTAACPDSVSSTQVRSSPGSTTAALAHAQDAQECGTIRSAQDPAQPRHWEDPG